MGKIEAMDKSESLVVRVYDSSQLIVPAKAFWDYREQLRDNAEDKYQLVKRAVMSDALGVVEKPMPRGKRGEATPGMIYLRKGLDSVDRTNTLIHEWRHEILHFGPARSLVDDEFPKPIQECPAESVAYIVSRFLGIDSQFSTDYLLHYGNSAETLIKNMPVM